MNATQAAAITSRYWAERGGKPQPRPRHALTAAEENAYLVNGSRLCNKHDFYAGTTNGKRCGVARPARGAKLLHGLIQVAVGYEHLRRGNPKGMASLLRQGAAKLKGFTRRPGVKALRDRALSDAMLTLDEVTPPKLMLTITGHDARAPKDAIRIEVPPA